jgi:hypothetical protein
MRLHLILLAALASLGAAPFAPTAAVAQERAACAATCMRDGIPASCAGVAAQSCHRTIVLADRRDDCIASCENIYDAGSNEYKNCVRQCPR